MKIRISFYLLFFFVFILTEANASSRIEQAGFRLFPNKKGKLLSGSFHFQGGSAFGPRDVEILWQDRKIVFRHIQNKKTMSIPLLGKNRIKEIKYLDIKGLNVKINPGEDQQGSIQLNLKSLQIVGIKFEQIIEDLAISCSWGNLKAKKDQKDFLAMCLRGESKISVGRFSLSKGFVKFLRQSIGKVSQAGEEDSCKNVAIRNGNSRDGFLNAFYNFFISVADASDTSMVSNDSDCFRDASLDVIKQAFGKIYSFLVEQSDWKEFGKNLKIKIKNGVFNLVFPYEKKKIKIKGSAQYFPPSMVKLTLKKAKYGFFDVTKKLFSALRKAQINADSKDFNIKEDNVFVVI